MVCERLHSPTTTRERPCPRRSRGQNWPGGQGTEVSKLMNLLNAAEVSLFLGEWSDTRAAIAELGQRDLPSEQRAYLSCTEAMLAALTGTPGRGLGLSRTARRPPGLPQRCVTGRATYLIGSGSREPRHR